MNRLSPEKRRQVVASLVEGNSIRATVRMTGVAKNTVTKLLIDLGTVCSIHQDRVLRNLPCERIECDEIWAFCYAKKKNVPADKRDLGCGDVWTWVALDPDTKLVPTFHVSSGRDLREATAFLKDLGSRLRNRVQLTTDGRPPYKLAVEATFEGNVDYAQLIKHYGPNRHGEGGYSPPTLIDTTQYVIAGDPDPARVSTSYIERQNLTMRMSMRRFTRLTNGFSKKVENLAAAVSLHFAHYNFCRVHKTLGTTPAVAAGVSDHVWKLDELIGLLEEAEATPIRRGSYAKTRVTRARHHS
jgi:IS1 family transposase